MKRFSCLFATVLILLCVLSACKQGNDDGSSKEAKTDYPVSALDVTLESCPQRVVSLSAYVTEVLLELGNEAQLVGVSDACVLDRELPRLGTTTNPATADILAYNPDVIFTTAALSEADKTALSAKGATVVTVAGADAYGDLLQQYTDIAQLVSGSITGTRNAVNTFNRLDEAIKSLKKPSKSVPIAIFCDACLLVPQGGLTDELLAFAGATNVVTDETMSDKEIVAAGAKRIVCREEDADALKQRFPTLTVSAFDVSSFEVYGERTVTTLKALNQAIRA